MDKIQSLFLQMQTHAPFHHTVLCYITYILTKCVPSQMDLQILQMNKNALVV